MSERSSRLEEALEAWLEFQQKGGTREELLARHPDKRELLLAFFSDEPDAEPEGPPAERLLGDFRLVRELGRGGMGVVFEAKQLSLDRRVAIKVLAPGLANLPATLTRFRREALHLARLDHPGILHVLDVGENGGEHWLAMELVDGESLDRRLDALREKRGHEGDSLRRLIAIVEQVARALQHAHEHGIVHRDVKPSNILVRRDGQAVLGDFGLAREEADTLLTQPGMVAGTPNYLSPEQVLHGSAAADARSDLFALGVTLYECITLRLPFDAPDITQVLHAIVHRDPVDPRRLQPGVPPDLAAIVQKTLEKEPDRRYPTCGAFADDLRAFLDLRPVQARPLSGPTRLRRWVRREPLRATLAATIVVAAGLGGYLALRMPDIRAAESARAKVAYEDAIVAGLLARTGSDKDVAYTRFAEALELAPGRGEAIAGLCLTMRHFEGPAKALAELERRTGLRSDDEDVERIRSLLLRRLHREDEAKALDARLGEPRTPNAMLLLAATLVDDPDDEAALSRARQLLSLATRIAPAPRLLYHVQWAAVEHLAGTPATEAEAAEALLRLWPEHPLALSTAGLLLFRSAPARSVDVLQRSLRLGHDDPLARVNLSLALEGAGRLAEAAAEAHEALAQEGLRGAGLARLGDQARGQMLDLLHRLHDPGEGDECERWLRDAPDNLQALRRVGQFASMHDDHEKAVRLLRAAHERAPQDPEPAWDLAFALSRAGETEAAAAALTAIAAGHPQHEQTHALLLDVYDDLMQAGPKLEELARWAAAKGDDREAWTELARALLARPGQDAARRALDAAERADWLAGGKDPEALELRAKAQDRLGNKPEAARLRERASGGPPSKGNGR